MKMYNFASSNKATSKAYSFNGSLLPFVYEFTSPFLEKKKGFIRDLLISMTNFI